MALALTNGARRKINKVARAIAKGMDPEQAVAAYYAGSLPKRRPGAGAWLKANAKSLRKPSKEESKRARQAKSLAAQALAKRFGMASGTSTDKRGRVRHQSGGMISRHVAQGAGRRYTSLKTKTEKRKLFDVGHFAKTGKKRFVERSVKSRDVGERGQYESSRFAKWGKKRKAARDISGSHTISGMSQSELESIYGAGSGLIAAGAKNRKKHPSLKAGPRVDIKTGRVYRRDASRNLGYKGESRVINRSGFSVSPKRPDLSHLAMDNGGALIPMGALALTNPMADYSDWAMALAGGIAIAGAGLATARLASAKLGLSEYYAKVPVAGEYMAANPAITTALLMAAIAGPIAGAVGFHASSKPAQLVAGAFAAAGATAGAVWLSDMLADKVGPMLGVDSAPLAGLGYDLNGLALENGFGALALENLGDLDAIGDGFAYQTAPLTASSGAVDFGQACLADAAYSGADFSAQEGQALLNGASSFVGAYGAPSYRMGGASAGASHLAGKPGHRWGWMIKLIGMEKTRAVCALKPADRVKLIAKIRAAALKAHQESTEFSAQSDARNVAAASSAGVDAPLVSGSGFGAAMGASGAGSFGGDFGASLFLGE